MLLTDAGGYPLTEDDLTFLDAHPRIARLAVKRVKIERQEALTQEEKRLALLGWAWALLPCSFHSVALPPDPPSGHSFLVK